MVKHKINNRKILFSVCTILILLLSSFLVVLFNKPYYQVKALTNDIVDANYTNYTNSINLLYDTDKTIFDYVDENNPLKGTKSKVTNSSEIVGRTDMILTGSGDDDIVQIVPKELFATVGEKLCIGNEYGFFISTNLDDGNYSSTVVVFAFINDLDLDKNVDTISVGTKVLFELNYAYLLSSKTEYAYLYGETPYNVQYSISEDTVALLPSHLYLYGIPYACVYDDVEKYMIKDIGMGISLYNEQDKNIGDLGYNPYNDIGSYITSYDYFARGKRKTSINTFEYIDVDTLDVINENLNWAFALLGWLKYVPEIGTIIDNGVNILQTGLDIYDWFKNVQSISNDDVIQSILFDNNHNAKMSISSYYQNRDDQLSHYTDSDGNASMIKTATVPFTAISDSGVWYGGQDYARTDFRINHSALNQQANYTRLVTKIDFKIIDTEENNIIEYFTKTSHFNLREPVYKNINLEEDNGVFLLPNGHNYFRFNALYESDYQLSLDNSSDVVVKVNNNIVNFNDNKSTIHLGQGQYDIEIINPSKTNKSFGNLHIEPATYNSGTYLANINANSDYLIKANMSQAKTITTGNNNINVTKIFYGSLNNEYVGKGVISPTSNLSHLYIDGKYYFILHNNANETSNLELSVADVDNIEIGSKINLTLNGDNYQYFKVTPSEGGTYILSMANMSNVSLVVYNNDATISNANSTYYPGVVYEIGFDANKTYYIGIKSNVVSENSLVINKKEMAYSWSISDGKTIVDTNANTFNVVKGVRYTLSLKANGFLLNNITIGIVNQDTAYGVYPLNSTNANQIEFNTNSPIGGNGVIVKAVVGYGTSLENIASIINIIPTFDRTFYVTSIINNEELKFTYNTTRYIYNVQFSLYPYTSVYNLDLSNIYATVDGTYTGSYDLRSIVDNMVINNGLEVYLKIINFSYYDAFRNSIVVTNVAQYDFPFNILYASGKGIDSEPYMITSNRHFNNISRTEATYGLGANLDFGNMTEAKPEFKGKLFGNTYTISYYMDVSSEGDFGLFKQNSGTIQHLKVNARISVYNNVGGWVRAGLFAGVNTGTISNCQAYGSVNDTRESSQSGGFVGRNEYTIDYCTNYATITCYGDTGGIAGANYTGAAVIGYCVNNGNVNYYYYANNRSVGGILGYQDLGNVHSCTNNGTISYMSPSSDSRTLQPNMGQIVGNSASGYVGNNVCNGTVNIGTLHTETWKTGTWPFQKKHTHNQAEYAGNRGVGKGVDCDQE